MPAFLLSKDASKSYRILGNSSTLSPESFYRLHPCKRPALLYLRASCPNAIAPWQLLDGPQLIDV
jgi:hypothetical protein